VGLLWICCTNRTSGVWTLRPHLATLASCTLSQDGRKPAASLSFFWRPWQVEIDRICLRASCVWPPPPKKKVANLVSQTRTSLSRLDSVIEGGHYSCDRRSVGALREGAPSKLYSTAIVMSAVATTIAALWRDVWRRYNVLCVSIGDHTSRVASSHRLGGP